MNKYETIIIVTPKIDEAAFEEIVHKFEDIINKEGKVENTEIWGKRKLAYPIQKNNEGYYCLYTFTSKPEFIDELNRIYNITDDLLKHIIVKLD